MQRMAGTGFGAGCVAGLSGLLLLVTGCADRERIGVPTDASGFTERGWDFFSSGNLEQARTDFESALDRDDDHGPAYVGLGWVGLRLATDTGEMDGAVGEFDRAADRGESGAEVLGGKAAALLGREDTASLSQAVTLAQNARLTDASFRFEHLTSFDSTDLFLIEAFALAAQGNIAEALAVADAAPVGNSGIDAGVPGTWQVDGTTYPTFEGAALAFLHKLSEEHAG